MEGLIKKLELEDYQVTKTTIGRSSNDVYRLQNDTDTLYLKVGGLTVKNLGEVLELLQSSNLNVPKLIQKGIYNDMNYVLMSECSGTMIHEIDPIIAVKVLAKGLKQIHELDIKGIKIVRDYKYYKNRIIEKVGNQLNIEDMRFVNELESLKVEEDLVFTHGDYCLPNILYDNGKISFIDLDDAGVSFRYIDILDCIWSIQYNFNDEKYVDMFLKEYGIDELDLDKVKTLKTIQRLLEIKGY